MSSRVTATTIDALAVEGDPGSLLLARRLREHVAALEVEAQPRVLAGHDPLLLDPPAPAVGEPVERTNGGIVYDASRSGWMLDPTKRSIRP